LRAQARPESSGLSLADPGFTGSPPESFCNKRFTLSDSTRSVIPAVPWNHWFNVMHLVLGKTLNSGTSGLPITGQSILGRLLT
jgi:hypothetical protein